MIVSILLSFAAIWHKVVNNTIPQGVRVRWNLTDHRMEYTHTLIHSLVSEKQTGVSINKNSHNDAKEYSMDNFLKHFYQVGNQMFLTVSKPELEQYVRHPEFIENLAYNASDLSTGIVMANSEVIDVLVDNLELDSTQAAFMAIVQNNPFAQNKIKERYPYLLLHLVSLPTTKTSVKMISSFLRGNSELSQLFVDQVGLEWLNKKTDEHPKLFSLFNCLGYDIGNSIPNEAIKTFFNCD
eukprot:NODE_520_length_7308_cov_0.176862.p2 type:complete len:239 gc:universal NODE_520_length_7308_cov_0.176862:5986-6702(+)